MAAARLADALLDQADLASIRQLLDDTNNHPPVLVRAHEGHGAQRPRMLSACRDMGLPPPVWEEIGNRIRVTMRRSTAPAHSVRDETGHYTAGTPSPGEAASVQPRDQAILSALDSSDGLGTRQIAEAIGLSTRATRTRLKGLVDRGLVVEIGTGPNDPGRRYYGAHG